MSTDQIPDAPVRTPGAAPAAPRPARPKVGAALRPLLLRLHFFAGLLIAPFLLVAAVTGLLYAGSWQAERLVYAHELTVENPGSHPLPLGAQVDAARAAAPDGEVVSVWPAPDPGSTTRVLMEAPGLAEGETRTVFVNPYTGDVHGQLTTVGDALPLRAWLSTLHADLHLGPVGRNYSELAASWLWIVALGGLALWIGRRRARRADLVRPDRRATGRRRALSWHATVGLWAVAGLVLLSATGLTWSKYAGENIGQLRESLGQATPSVSAALDGAAPGGADEHAGHTMAPGETMPEPAAGADVGLDRAWAAARAAGVTEEVRITLPTPGTGYVFKEQDKQVPVHLDAVSVNPADGTVLDELRFADQPLLAQATRFGIDLHMGLTFGLANQLALAALALALILVIVQGYRMWWLRRPTKDRRLSVGRAQPRGAWRKVPVTALLPLAAVTALVGWFAPLLGWSLLAFLVVDGVLGLVARRRAKA
ncbi:PepSY-associated TM helix domain-containing protein [Streptomyces sp. BI20]|uniref:PepSY-associated TM helix domain-containing protein n=1 Tax=Streptomyces sp. BI20 TaxID=3403460 RepID=UPI003C769E00